jgi:hypothetical protein
VASARAAEDAQTRGQAWLRLPLVDAGILALLRAQKHTPHVRTSTPEFETMYGFGVWKCFFCHHPREY